LNYIPFGENYPAESIYYLQPKFYLGEECIRRCKIYQENKTTGVTIQLYSSPPMQGAGKEELQVEADMYCP
jgi:hypothetical protein